MRVLVLGAEGMLGSVLLRSIPNSLGTVRGVSNDSRVLGSVDIRDDLHFVFDWARPGVVINCAGIVKSECVKYSGDLVTDVNGRAPHRVAERARRYGCRVIQISTDCVFDGSRGNRIEEEVPDAVDIYGRSKAAGELVGYDHCVTVRTSFVGRDRRNHRGLLEWLLSSKSSAPAHTRAMWSGLSTHELARALMRLIANEVPGGVYHIAGPVISKADLLRTLIEAFDFSRPVDRVIDPLLDRSLYGGKFARAAGYAPPTWAEMAQELAGLDF